MSTLSTSEFRAAQPRTGDARPARNWKFPSRDGAPPAGTPAPASLAPTARGATTGAVASQTATLRASLDAAAGEDARVRYFGSLDGVRVENGELVVPVTSAFAAGLAERRFGSLLRSAAHDLFGAESMRLDILPAPDTRPPTPEPPRSTAPGESTQGRPSTSLVLVSDPAPGRAAPAARPGLPEGPSRVAAPRMLDNGRARHTFETFIEGASNALALHAARGLASGDVRLSPLFIHGPCGTGKTHLLQAVAHSFRGSELRVRCLTGEAFTNEFISAMRAQRLDDFRRDFRRVDLLCLDDVHFIADKKATQAELLHTFDAVDLKGKLVVLASDEHPDRIARLGNALASRFVSGAVAALAAPDDDLCRRLLTVFAARREAELEPGAASLLLDRFEALRAESRLSVRDVEASVTQVVAMSRLTGERGPVSATLAARALGISDRGPASRARRPVPVDRLLHATCEALAVDRAEFAGRSRAARVVLARGLAALLARELTNLSFPEIARAMGRPNHSTVITAMNRMRSQLEGAGPPVGIEGGRAALRALAEKVRRELVKAAGGPIGA